MTAVPTSPEELLDCLFAIFPRFQANYDGPIFDQPLSYDSVLTAFTSDFGLEFPNSSDDQLRDFAALLNAAVAQGGELERAFSQCFLDHALQIHMDHVLWRYFQAQHVNASSPNQSMKPTAPLRNKFSVLVTTPHVYDEAGCMIEKQAHTGDFRM